MVIDLTIAGLVEAQVWESSAPWIDSVRGGVASYWLVRTLSGLPILTGFVLSGFSRYRPRVSEATTSATSRVAPENNVAFVGWSRRFHTTSSRPVGSAMRMWSPSAPVVGFFALSFLVLAILLARTGRMKSSGWLRSRWQRLTASEQRVAESFMDAKDAPTVTTQQVRSLAADVRRFGSPTEAWETKYDYPQLWGNAPYRAGFCRANSTFVPATGNSPSLQSPARRPRFRDASVSMAFSVAAPISRRRKVWICSLISNLSGRARQLSGFDQQALTASVPCREPDMAMASEPSARSHSSHRSDCYDGRIQRQRAVLHPASSPDDLQEEGKPRRYSFCCELCFVSWVRRKGPMAKLPRVYCRSPRT